MSSNPVQKATNGDDLRKDLDTVVEGLIKKIQNLHQTDDRVDITRTYILEHVRLKMLPDVNVVEPNPINVAAGLGPLFFKLPQQIRDMIYPTGLGPFLFKLPREVRDKIYQHVLASGHTQFLRASRALKKEGTSLISQHGICRINIGFQEKTGFAQPVQQMVNTIKNLDVRIDTKYSPGYSLKDSPGSQLLEMFARAKFLTHRTCTVILKTYPVPQAEQEALNLLKHFEGFEEVTVRIKYKLVSSMFTYDNFSHWHSMRDEYLRLEFARRELEPTLGTAHQGWYNEGWHMTFSPMGLSTCV